MAVVALAILTVVVHSPIALVWGALLVIASDMSLMAVAWVALIEIEERPCQWAGTGGQASSTDCIRYAHRLPVWSRLTGAG
jgi:hypothetical protein